MQVRADLRSVCLEALTEKTADGQKALQLRKEADKLMEKFNKVIFTKYFRCTCSCMTPCSHVCAFPKGQSQGRQSASQEAYAKALAMQ